MAATQRSHRIGAAGRGLASRPRVAALALGAGVALAVVLAGCSSSTTSSTSSSATTATTAASSSGSSALGALATAFGKSGQSFSATYTVTSGGKTQTITFAQAPGKSLVQTPSGSFIQNGKTTYVCSTSSGATTCESFTGTNPFASLLGLVSPSTYLPEIKSYQSEVNAHAAGVVVSSGSKTIAGQSADCVTVTVHSSSATGTYCALTNGVLAYINSAAVNLTLTQYSSSPAASLFSPPAGATVQTLPAGVTIP